MKPIAIAAIIFALALPAIADEKKASEMMQAAQAKETVQGDLKAAIQLYGQAVKEAGANRGLAAKSLLRMAECYRKMGDAEARKIYQQIVRDYGDQKAAVAEAKTWLGGTARSGDIVTRQIWAGPNVDVYGAVSPDGRLITFYDKSGDLAVHDVVTGEERRLTKKGPAPDPTEYGQASAFAPDAKHVAYTWLNQEGRYDLRVVAVAPDPARKPRILCDNAEISWIAPYDWSHDGKWIAVQIQRLDRTAQIGLVSAADGSLRILKSIDWRGSLKLAFSPDSRYLAFDLPAGEGSDQRDVFVLATDGSSESLAVTAAGEALVAGWTPDGKNLIFTSDRTGKTAVYAAPFENGKRRGEDKLLDADIGQSEVMGLLRSGSLYCGIRTGSRGFYTASVDFESGKLLTSRSAAAQKYLGTNYQPDWSRDGQLLSYQSYGGQRRGVHLALRSLQQGTTHEIWPRLSYLGFAHWLPDGKSLIASGSDLKGRVGLYRIDAHSGDTALVLPCPPGQVIISPRSSADGKKIYYTRGADGRTAPKPLFEYDVPSSSERELIAPRCTGNLSLAPGGESVACSTFDPATKEPGISIVSLERRSSRELLRLKPEDAFTLTFVQWTPDGRSIVFPKSGEIWIVPAAGGSPRKMELGVGPVLDLRIHPDGRQIAFTTRNRATQEIRAVEHLFSTLDGAN